LDADTYSSPLIQQDLNRLILVKLNAANHPRLVRRYRIKTIPAIVFYTSQARYMTRLVNFIGPKKLHQQLTQVDELARKLENRLAELKAKVAAAPKQIDPLLELAGFHSRRYENARAMQLWRQALTMQPAEPAASLCRLGLAQFLILERKFLEAEKLIDAVSASSKSALNLARAQFYKGLCLYYGHNSPPKARAVWRALRKAHPKMIWGVRARELLLRKFGDEG